MGKKYSSLYIGTFILLVNYWSTKISTQTWNLYNSKGLYSTGTDRQGKNRYTPMLKKRQMSDVKSGFN